ncbi:MAG: GNAT family N-acetyltransferase [Pseudomonadota bacterium]
MAVTVTLADLAHPGFAALVDRHAEFCAGTAPAESQHRLERDELAAPDITVWQASVDGQLVGMAALKALGPLGGEVKSMHTVAEARGQGVGEALLSTIKTAGRQRGYPALWLETGAHPDFDRARKFYAANCFEETPPFGTYRLDPHSVFMTCTLAGTKEG